jgi:hypothetical protein
LFGGVIEGLTVTVAKFPYIVTFNELKKRREKEAIEAICKGSPQIFYRYSRER